MGKSRKKILIVDESGFSRICSAILEQEGYGTSTIADPGQFDAERSAQEIGLVITSYPYGSPVLEKLKQSQIPTIILSDRMSRDLIATLDHFDKSRSHCMIKPLDYHKFRLLVNQAMQNCENPAGK